MGTPNAGFDKLLEYERRARRFEAAKAGGGARHGESTGVIFRIGAHHLTCSVRRVREFLPLPACTRVPGAKPWILGLANIRGELVTIVDLAWFLTGQRSATTLRSRLLTASLRGRPIGLLVDEVYGHRNFPEGDPVVTAQADDPQLGGFIGRKLRSGQDSWGEIDLDALFNSADFLNGAAD
jgi:twitching motility protein PilI